jgi:hypothetical protein
MKFVVMMKNTPEVIRYAEEHSGKRYGNGANLRGYSIVDLITPFEEKKNAGIAFLCTGPLWSYLWHKIHLECIHHACSVLKGW